MPARALTPESLGNHNATLAFSLSAHPFGESTMHATQLIARKPYRTGITLVAAALVGLYGCGKEEPKQAPAAPAAAAAAPTPAAETTKVTIGHAGPLTGSIAHLGKDDENGVHLAVDEANTKKIKIGGKTITFVMMSEDDQADPKLGPTIAQKFVDAKVAGVVGHLNSGVSIPASAVYNQAGMPMISGSATNPKLTEQGFKTIFRTVGRDD
ncbi:MAG: branched-chain amino acid ABC transporter substrate-binding protein, partial [Betaproteobacteria bacterium]